MENPKSFINECQKEYVSKVVKAAKLIARNMSNCPIVLLSGPSGSGKTTIAKDIENILCKKGYEAHTLSMDNYFRSLSNSEKDAVTEGTLSLEAPSRLDIPLLNEQIEKMISCREVELPVYNFEISKQLPSGISLKRKQGEIIIFEGIHALNPNVISVDGASTEKIYVSVRTRIKNGGVVLHPSKIRLLRRMLRDKLYRGRSFQKTVERFFEVEQGEKDYIMPYKNFANHHIDTFIPYEMGVYKSILKEETVLFKDNPILTDIYEIFKATEEISPKLVPKNALIREFIG